MRRRRRGCQLTPVPNAGFVLVVHPRIIYRSLRIPVQKPNLLRLLPDLRDLHDLLAVLIEDQIPINIDDGHGQVLSVKAALQTRRGPSSLLRELANVRRGDILPVHLSVDTKVENEIDLLLRVLAVCARQTRRVRWRLPRLLVPVDGIREGRHMPVWRYGNGRRGRELGPLVMTLMGGRPVPRC